MNGCLWPEAENEAEVGVPIQPPQREAGWQVQLTAL